MLRTCKTCGKVKDLEDFVKGKGELRRYWCKECKNSERRTGLPNLGRFKKGDNLRNQNGFRKGENLGNTTGFQKGHLGYLKHTPKTKHTRKYRIWREGVLERDGNKCTKCDSTYRLAAHHIVPWKDDETKRYDIDNGVALCNQCHGKEEGIRKGQQFNPETQFKKGQVPWNKKVK